MQIVHLSSEQSWRGGEKQISLLMTELSKQTNIEQHLYAPKHSALAKWADNKGFGFHTYKKHSSQNFSLSLKLLGKHHQANTIFHAHDSHSLNSLYWLSFVKNFRAVFTRRTAFRLSSGKEAKFKQLKNIICISGAVLASVARVNTPRTLIHSGIQLRNEPLKNWKVVETPFQILGIGALSKEKNWPYFLDIASELAKLHPIQVTIIGEGPEKATIYNKIKALGIEDYVLLKGFVEDADVYLKQAHALMHVPKHEALGNVLLEAINHSCLCITNQVGGISDIVSNKNGIIVPSDNAQLAADIIHNQINKPIGINKKLECAIKKLDDFELQTMTAKHIALYKDILGQ